MSPKKNSPVKKSAPAPAPVKKAAPVAAPAPAPAKKFGFTFPGAKKSAPAPAPVKQAAPAPAKKSSPFSSKKSAASPDPLAKNPVPGLISNGVRKKISGFKNPFIEKGVDYTWGGRPDPTPELTPVSDSDAFFFAPWRYGK